MFKFQLYMSSHVLTFFALIFLFVFFAVLLFMLLFRYFQGGFFTNMVDEEPTKTSFAVPPGLTQVKVLDYNFVNFINFEAEINYAEEEGIVQVRVFLYIGELNFGMNR